MDKTNIIGEKIRGLRMAKEISLDELADRTGLAIEQITRIEENIDIPSLAPLVKLARALGVRLGTFLDDQPDEAGPVVCIIRKSKFPQNPKRSVRFSGKRTKRSVQKRKARNTQKAETKVL